MNDVIGTGFATATPSPSMRRPSRPLSIIRENPDDELKRASFQGNEPAAKPEENNESDSLLVDDLSRSGPGLKHDDVSKTHPSLTDNVILRQDASSNTNNLSKSNVSSRTIDIPRSGVSSRTNDLSRSNISLRTRLQPRSETSLKSNYVARSDPPLLHKKDDLPAQRSAVSNSSVPQRHLRRVAVAPLQHPLYSLSKGDQPEHSELPRSEDELQRNDSTEDGYGLHRRIDFSKDGRNWAKKSAFSSSTTSSSSSLVVLSSSSSLPLSSPSVSSSPLSFSSLSSQFKSVQSQGRVWNHSETEVGCSYRRHTVSHNREYSKAVLKSSGQCADKALEMDEEGEEKERTEKEDNSGESTIRQFHSYVDDQFCDVDSDTEDNRVSNFSTGMYRGDSRSGEVCGDVMDTLLPLSGGSSREDKTSIDSDQSEWIERVKKSSRFKDVREEKFDSLVRSVSSNDADSLRRGYSCDHSFIPVPDSTNSDLDVTLGSKSIRSKSVCDFSAFGRERKRQSSLTEASTVTAGRASQKELMQNLIDAIYSKTRNSSQNHTTQDVPIKGRSNAEEEAQSTDTSKKSQEPIRRISTIDQSALSLLKATTSRLCLPTRRASTAAWRAKYLDNPSHLLPVANKGGEDKRADKIIKDLPLTPERKSKIDESLSWLKHELINIRLQDQALARQFLNIRHTMNTIRLAVECEGHQDLLDTAEEDMEELRELSQLVDVPTELLSPFSPLKQIGITRMNISSRRFSTC